MNAEQYEGIVALLRSIRGRMPAPAGEESDLRPVRLATPQGVLDMWIDETCESHFRMPGSAVPDTWRRVYVR